MRDMPSPRKIENVTSQQCEVNANKVNLFLKCEIISVCVSKTKPSVITAIVFKCSRWDLLIFILCNVFNLKKNVETIKK